MSLPSFTVRIRRSTYLVVVVAVSFAPARADDDRFKKDVRPFLEKHCFGCHAGNDAEGKLRLDVFKITADAQARKMQWYRVQQALRNGKMPPADEPRPDGKTVDRIVKWIDADVLKIDCGGPRDSGRVTIRRLNRAEYNNTIRDLVGVDFRPGDDFPVDDSGYGFDTIGDVLSMSPLLFEKYLAAAEKITATAIMTDSAKELPDTHKRIVFTTPKSSNRSAEDCAKEILKQFATRAYRRPVTSQEIDRLTTFVKKAKSDGDSFERGIQLALQAVLVSPNFLFRAEKDEFPKQPDRVHPISEHELATRISYFLWSSMPDDALLEEATQGTLRKNLEAQVRRMLAGSKSRALVDNFAGQWLETRKLATVTPDPERFKPFDDQLRADMRTETEKFFEHVVHEDRSILDFLDGRYSFINARLAKHYGIDGIKGDEFRRVELSDPKRGGVLTHASVLTITSNPTRTSPVKRGKWIMEQILGTPPPPPPPEVPELEEQSEADATASLRQRMETHRKNPLCASCHQQMDALGFGLENFDAIGRWRDKDGKFAIDPAGTLPGGVSFNSPAEMRQKLSQSQRQAFTRCLAEKLLTYALGRGVEFYDKCALDDITSEVEKNGHRFSTLVLAVVKSDPFQNRRAKRPDG